MNQVWSSLEYGMIVFGVDQVRLVSEAEGFRLSVAAPRAPSVLDPNVKPRD